MSLNSSLSMPTIDNGGITFDNLDNQNSYGIEPLSFNNSSTDTSSMSTLDGLRTAQTDLINSSLADKNSTWGAGGTVDQFASNAGKIIGGISSLANIYLGFKQLDLAKDELNIKKDQWAESKKELKHMQATRKRITDSYKSGSAVPR